jgi:hypothetical protein
MRSQLAKWIVNVLKHLKRDGQDGLFIAEMRISSGGVLSDLTENADFNQYTYDIKKRQVAGRQLFYLSAAVESEQGKVLFKCTLVESVNTNPDFSANHNVSVLEEIPVKDAHTINKASVDAYIQYSNDDNVIHRGGDAVIPAVVIIDEVFALDQMLTSAPSVRFRFKNALLVDQQWEYDIQTRRGMRGDKILFTVQVK